MSKELRPQAQRLAKLSPILFQLAVHRYKLSLQLDIVFLSFLHSTNEWEQDLLNNFLYILYFNIFRQRMHHLIARLISHLVLELLRHNNFLSIRIIIDRCDLLHCLRRFKLLPCFTGIWFNGFI